MAVIRELPIKNFYVRCWLTYFWMMFFVSKGLGRGLRYQRPIVFYNHQFHARALLNYPDLFWWNLTRVLPKNPPVPDSHREWRTRKQPVMPYLMDAGTDVINGTFKRNCNSTAPLK